MKSAQGDGAGDEEKLEIGSLQLLSGRGASMVTDEFFAEVSEESRVKQTIVSTYFRAWANVLMNAAGRRDKRIAYIDLFAGRGRYEDGTPSTPLLVLQAAVENVQLRENLAALFNDADPAKAETLREEIGKLEGIEQLVHAPRVSNETVDEELVKRLRETHLVPSFVFIDPWGYKGFSLELVEAVLKDWGTDVLFFFNYNRVNMSLGKEEIPESLLPVFGEERTRQLQQTPTYRFCIVRRGEECYWVDRMVSVRRSPYHRRTLVRADRERATPFVVSLPSANPEALQEVCQ